MHDFHAVDISCGQFVQRDHIFGVVVLDFQEIGNLSKYIDEAAANKVKILVFPELAITGYTCGDLFLQTSLLEKAKEQLFDLMEYTVDKDMIIVIGLPFELDHRLYNVAAVIANGSLLGLVPKRFIPNYSEFYEKRHFAEGNELPFYL